MLEKSLHCRKWTLKAVLEKGQKEKRRVTESFSLPRELCSVMNKMLGEIKVSDEMRDAILGSGVKGIIVTKW